MFDSSSNISQTSLVYLPILFHTDFAFGSYGLQACLIYRPILVHISLIQIYISFSSGWRSCAALLRIGFQSTLYSLRS